MKKFLYFATALLATTFTSCQSNSEYDNYVDSLNSKLQEIDTISSGISYFEFINRLDNDASAFQDKGIELNEEQLMEITRCGTKINDALRAKYTELANTPMTIPSDQFVENADSTEIVAAEAAAPAN